MVTGARRTAPVERSRQAGGFAGVREFPVAREVREPRLAHAARRARGARRGGVDRMKTAPGHPAAAPQRRPGEPSDSQTAGMVERSGAERGARCRRSSRRCRRSSIRRSRSTSTSSGSIYDVIVDAVEPCRHPHDADRAGVSGRAVAAGRGRANAVAAVPGVTDVKVDIVWDPPWTRERMSDAAKSGGLPDVLVACPAG